jgi:NDP-sugar pyrophosphorylase family protein
MDLGYQTIIQDDEFVRDMVSGFFFIRKTLKSEKHAVLVPSDNISDVDLDGLIEHFLDKRADISFSLYEVEEMGKITEMGCYDPQGGQFYYKHPHPPTRYGVIAPYVVKNGINEQGEIELLSKENVAYGIHTGFWFDVGDFKSIIEASKFIMRRRSDVKGK